MRSKKEKQLEKKDTVTEKHSVHFSTYFRCQRGKVEFIREKEMSTQQCNTKLF